MTTPSDFSSDEKKGIRINRYLGLCGFCSRRRADEYIENDRVTIDDATARKGDHVTPAQCVRVDGTALFPENEKIYIILNKPLYVTCTAQKEDLSNVIDFLHFPKRIFPVGRLDKMSTGLLLLTNDGDLSYHLLRTGEHHEKEYIVTVNPRISGSLLEKLQKGVKLSDKNTLPCHVEKIDEWSFRIVLTQGLNRQIRRMCKVCGYEVIRLKRIRFANLHLDGLEEGRWRHLTQEEKSGLLSCVSRKAP